MAVEAEMAEVGMHGRAVRGGHLELAVRRWLLRRDCQRRTQRRVGQLVEAGRAVGHDQHAQPRGEEAAHGEVEPRIDLHLSAIHHGCLSKAGDACHRPAR